LKLIGKFCLYCLLIVFTIPAVGASLKVATDPSRIGTGARTLGMGKSFVAVADDVSAMFLNPAALASLSNWQFTSMQGRFLSEYDYLNCAYALPTDLGTFGLGYAGSGISFMGASATQEVIDGVRIISSSTEGVTYSFYDQVVLLSWAANPLRNLSFGTTYKFFSLGMSGAGISNGTASGNEVDLGIVFCPHTVLRTALSWQNALSFDAGGKIKWANGSEETLRSTIKLGLNLHLLGPDGIFEAGDNLLSLNLDHDSFPKESPDNPNLPELWHGGLEWSPSEFLDLRVGVDQDIVGSGTTGLLDVSNNLTSGIGLYFNHFRFDYAYHQYNALSDNDTHYFSLTYGVENKRKKKEPAPKEVIELNPEIDETIVQTDKGLISGQVNHGQAKIITVNTQSQSLKDKHFALMVPLNLGKNAIIIKAYDAQNNLLSTKKLKVLRLTKIPDVPDDHWAKTQIQQLVSLGILTIFPDGNFKPEKEISRADLLIELLRANQVRTAEVTNLPFTDIELQEWIAPYVQAGYNNGIVYGYPDGTFGPWRQVNRAEGIVMMIRVSNLKLPTRLQEKPYQDIGARHWAIKEIALAKQKSMLKFVLENFDPEKKLSRAELAATLIKADFVQEQVKALLDWGIGY